MKFLATSLFILSGFGEMVSSNEITNLLGRYINWTTTGHKDAGEAIFDKHISLSYKSNATEVVTSFLNYKSKIEQAANVVSRSMSIHKIDLDGEQTTVYIKDYLLEEDLELLHILTLEKTNEKWRIKSILIEDAPANNENEWKLSHTDKADPPAWNVYERDVEGSKFHEFKIVGHISASPREGIDALIEKTVNSEKYLEEQDGFIEVLSRTDNELLIYSEFNLPFIFKDRAMCERFKVSHDESRGTYKVSWVEDWDAAPALPDNVIAMPKTRGSWTFEPSSSGGSIATYSVYAEPGGSIPAWMVNMTVGKGMHKELNSVEEIAAALRLKGF